MYLTLRSTAWQILQAQASCTRFAYTITLCSAQSLIQWALHAQSWWQQQQHRTISSNVHKGPWLCT